MLLASLHGEELTGLQYLHFTLAELLPAIPFLMTGRPAFSIGWHCDFNVGETALTEALAIVIILPVVVARFRRRTGSALHPCDGPRF